MEPVLFTVLMAWALVRYGVTDLVATVKGTESPRHRERRERMALHHERTMARMQVGPTIGQAVAGRIVRRIAEPRPPRHRSGHPFRRFLGEWWDDSWSRATEARHRHYERKCSGDLPRQRAGRAARHKCDEWRHRHDTDRATAERPTSPGAQTVPPESDTERTGPIHVVAERLPLPAADPDLLATPHPEERNPATMTDNHANTPPVADSTASEVTNINTALAYTRDMGEQFRAAVAHAETLGAQAHQMSGWAAQSTTNAETAVADISAGEVTGEAVESLRTAHEQMVIAAVQVDQAARALNVAQEQFAATAAAFDTAHQAFQRQQTVAEAYAANPDAGSKQFNTYA